MRKWNDKDLVFLKDNYKKLTAKELSCILDRSVDCIRAKARQLKISKRNILDIASIKVGQTFGSLIVLGIPFRMLCKNGKRYFVLCKCEICGKSDVFLLHDLIRGHTRGDGCNKPGNITHGQSKTRLYKIWKAMIQRCEYQNGLAYKNYGARGISVFAEWRKDFESFRLWSNENGYSENLTLDRINNDDGYNPSNCRWVDRKIQANNKRTNVVVYAFGETKTLMAWSEDPRCKVCYSTLYDRHITRGIDIETSILSEKL